MRAAEIEAQQFPADLDLGLPATSRIVDAHRGGDWWHHQSDGGTIVIVVEDTTLPEAAGPHPANPSITSHYTTFRWGLVEGVDEPPPVTVEPPPFMLSTQRQGT